MTSQKRITRRRGKARGTLSASDEPDAQSRDDARREFVRDIATDLRYWYSSAESKAQLVLTVNGIFLTFLTTGMLASRSTAAQATAVFGPETWVFLAAMSACLGLGILSAVACLASRGLRKHGHLNELRHHAVNPHITGSYPPELAAFFYDLTALEPRRYADRAFIFTGLTLGFFLATGVSYLIRVHLAA
jgi:hypothetical protein